jgi:hypothetical protein
MKANRKTLRVIALGALLCVSVGAETTLEEVLERYYEAIGGAEAWQAVDSLRMTGRMRMLQGPEAPFTMIFQRPMKTRLEFTLQGMTAIQAFDGETAWLIMPFMGKTEAEEMSEEQAKLMKEQADIEGPLVDWKEKGHTVEFLGEEEIDAERTFHLRVTLDSGGVRHYFLGADDYLPIRVEAQTTFEGELIEVETVFGDYREVGDLVMAHSVESKPKGAPAGQQLTIETAEVNVEIPEGHFSKETVGEEEAPEVE